MTDIVPERACRDDDKYPDNGDDIDEHNAEFDLNLRQVSSEAPGMMATIEAGAEIPPDGGYGWVCVACGFMINSCTWGVNSSYGVYLAHYLADDAFPGATPLQYAFVGGLSISSSMIIGPLVTILLRKTSTRKVMTAGIVLQTGGLIAASFSTKIWHLFLAQGVCFGLGMGFLYTGSAGVISQWFAKRRSVTTGITAAGSGIGGLIFSLSIRAMISSMGRAWAFRIVACVTLVNNAICTSLTRDRNKHVNPNQRAFDLGLLRRYEFLLVLSWGFFSMLGYVMILFSLPDFARSRGFSAVQGSILSALLNLSMAFGRPLVGLASDQYGRINISMAMTLVTGLSCLAFWLPAEQFGLAIFFALVNGAVCGTFWTTIAPVCVEVVGLKDLPGALSLVWLSTVLPTTFSEAIGLYLRRPDLKNQYLYPQIFAAVMYIAAAVSLWLVRVWKMGDNVSKGGDKTAAQRVSEKGNGEDPLEQREKELMAGEGLVDRWKSDSVSKWWRYGFV